MALAGYPNFLSGTPNSLVVLCGMVNHSDKVLHFYAVLKNSDDQSELTAIIDELRADNGRPLRALLRALNEDGSDDSARLAEVLKHHSSLRDLIPN